MKKLYRLAILFALIIAGCTTSQFVQTNVTPDTQPKIEIYLSSEAPQRQYEVIGHIRTSGSAFTSNESLVKGLREKAHEVGADAVIKTEFKFFSHDDDSIPYVEGIAVRYK